MDLFAQIREARLRMFPDSAPHEAPHIHAAVEELCRQAGIDKPRICFVNHSAAPPALRGKLAVKFEASEIVGGPRITMGAYMLHTLDFPEKEGEVHPRLRAVLAHEVTHLKNGDTKLSRVLAFRLAPVTGAIVGLAAVGYYEHLQHKAELAKAAGVPAEQVNREIHEQWQRSDQPKPGTQDVNQPLVTYAKMLAGALMGFAVGTAVFTMWHHHIEFRADRGAAELMGNGQPLADALKTIVDKTNAILARHPELAAQHAVDQRSLGGFLAKLTHPPVEERIIRLEAWSR